MSDINDLIAEHKGTDNLAGIDFVVFEEAKAFVKAIKTKDISKGNEVLKALRLLLDKVINKIDIDFYEGEIEFNYSAFCLTGNFHYITRQACERRIVELGGVMKSAVTANVNYLVVGALINPDWAHQSYGRKIEKAIEVIKKQGTSHYKPLRIVSETSIIKYFGSIAEEDVPQAKASGLTATFSADGVSVT